MLIIGLTGSIATGKSTVSSLLSSPPYSLPIIDTDLLARKVVEPGTEGYKAIVNYFGPTTPDLLLPASPPDSASSSSSSSSPNDTTTTTTTTTTDPQSDRSPRPLNRLALGRRVFGTTEDRKRDRMILNKIVHPLVRREVYKALAAHYVRGHWAVVLDVPLLFESGMDLICGTVVVVGVRDPAVQMQRLRARDPHLSAEEAANRVRSQGDVASKAARAEWRGPRRGLVVWNDGDKQALEGEVRRALAVVQASSPRWWAWVLLVLPPVGVLAAVWNLGVNFWGRRGWETRERERERERVRAKI
ncbi:CoaE-domain-containing protein [Aspergillus indologenus CBS 114.80]|uniref:CoaE-domain-containing protein n=1 Tax=Aspergillus indologenus CBS 114.80 TaxID=1450541 RepID=A0A2V5HW76_9EURO|nr:CoaE-domain-containing protein [Aspergillus indologenus CBS 114.80]